MTASKRHNWMRRRAAAGSVCQKCWATAVREGGSYVYRERGRKTQRLPKLPACSGYQPHRPGAWYGPYREQRAERHGMALLVMKAGRYWSAYVGVDVVDRYRIGTYGYLIGTYESRDYAMRRAVAAARNGARA